MARKPKAKSEPVWPPFDPKEAHEEAMASIFGLDRPALPQEPTLEELRAAYDDTPYERDSPEALLAHPFDPKARFKGVTEEWIEKAAKAARFLPRSFEGMTDKPGYQVREEHTLPQTAEAIRAFAKVAESYNADVLLDACCAIIAVQLTDLWFNASPEGMLNTLAIVQFQLNSLLHQMVIGAAHALAKEANAVQLSELFSQLATGPRDPSEVN